MFTLSYGALVFQMYDLASLAEPLVFSLVSHVQVKGAFY